jgi:hypothetical protein
MELLTAFSTGDGENLVDDHAGMAKHLHVYRFCEGKQELVEIRENVKFKGDESKKHMPSLGWTSWALAFIRYTLCLSSSYSTGPKPSIPFSLWKITVLPSGIKLEAKVGMPPPN